MKKTSGRLCLLHVLVVLWIGLNQLSAQYLAGPFDFSSTSQYTSNFFATYNGSALTVSSGQLCHTGAGAAECVYDTVPDGTATNATFSSVCMTTRFVLQSDNDSIGIRFGNLGNRSGNANLALFNVNTGSTSDDIIRFFKSGVMSTGSSGTQFGSTKTLSGGGFVAGQTYCATLVLSPLGSSGGGATLIISDPAAVVPTFIATSYYSGLGGTTGEVGLRSYKNASGTARFDDVAMRTPLGLTVLETSTCAAALSWPSCTGAVNYKLYRNGAWLGATTNVTYTDSGPLDLYKSYEYVVIALDANGKVLNASPTTVFAYRRFAFVMPWDDASTGTAADASGLSTVSASQTVTVSSGHFSAGGQRIRFLGVNLVARSCFPAHDDPVLGDVAEKMAARLEKLGVNCVRLHSIDRPAPDGVLASGRSTLDAAQMDKFDYFVSRLKAHGIYVDLNLHVYFGSNDDSFGLLPGVCLYNADMIQLQKDFAQALLTHTNPYTGLTYANDPVVALIEIHNEDGLIHSWRNGRFDTGTSLAATYCDDLKSQWNSWLSAKYSNTASVSAAWAASAGQSYGAALTTNGTFSGTVSPWSVNIVAPATGTYSVVAGGAPDGASNALRLSVTTADTAYPYHVEFHYSPVVGSSISTIQYTVKFWAKASSQRTMHAGFQQYGSSWNMLGSSDITITPDWRQYTLVIPVTASSSNARFIITNLAKQTGDIWLANMSVQTGNSLLGARSAWAEGGNATELAANGTFSGSLTPWSLSTASTALATQTCLTNGAPDGLSNALKITTTATASADIWNSVQLLQPLSGVTCYKDRPYTVSFQAKADSARSMCIFLQKNQSDWAALGYGSVNLTTDWQTYSVQVGCNLDYSNVRLALGGFGAQLGSVYLANVSLKSCTPGIGLPAGELLGSINILEKKSYDSRSRAAQQDWMTFLWQKESSYWSTMKSYVKTTLGAKGLLIGTQTAYSPVMLSADMDVIDEHAYWQHPVFPGTNWDANNWYIKNQSMAGDANAGAFGSAAMSRVTGKPFVCTEYNECAPITYGGETLLLAATYAALQDWDGLFLYNYENAFNNQEDNAAKQLYGKNYFQSAQRPERLVSMPVAATILRQGRVAAASTPVTASVTQTQATTMAARSALGASSFGIPSLAAMQWPVGMKVATTYSLVSSPYMPATTTDWLSSTGELTWDTSDKLVMVNTARVKAVVGKANGQSFDFGDGVVVTPGSSMQTGNWCAISMMTQDGVNFQSSGKLLITATGYADNHNMLWVTGKGPLDATTSVASNWGQAPSLIEGINASVTLPVAASRVSVWSLDVRGQHAGAVTVTGDASSATFALDRACLTAWYEVVIAP